MVLNNLYLLELFINDIKLDGFDNICISFQFLDNQKITCDESDDKSSQQISKSAIFSLQPHEVDAALQRFNIEVFVQEKLSPARAADSPIIGKITIPAAPLLASLVKDNSSSPITREYQRTFPLSKNGNAIGAVDVSLRLSRCKMITTKLQKQTEDSFVGDGPHDMSHEDGFSPAAGGFLPDGTEALSTQDDSVAYKMPLDGPQSRLFINRSSKVDDFYHEAGDSDSIDDFVDTDEDSYSPDGEEKIIQREHFRIPGMQNSEQLNMAAGGYPLCPPRTAAGGIIPYEKKPGKTDASDMSGRSFPCHGPNACGLFDFNIFKKLFGRRELSSAPHFPSGSAYTSPIVDNADMEDFGEEGSCPFHPPISSPTGGIIQDQLHVCKLPHSLHTSSGGAIMNEVKSWINGLGDSGKLPSRLASGGNIDEILEWIKDNLDTFEMPNSEQLRSM